MRLARRPRRLALEAALVAAARHRRRMTQATFIGVTGSCGKTTTKDLLASILAQRGTVKRTPGSDNRLTGVIGTVLRTAARDPFCVVEVASWGPGTVGRAARVLAPEIAVITNIGPVHLARLGDLPGVAAAKAELIAALAPGATAIIPAGEPRLSPYLRADVRTITFGEDGDVRLRRAWGDRLEIDLLGERIRLEVSFAQAHLRRNLLGAVAAAYAAGVVPHGRIDFAVPNGRGARVELAREMIMIDDSHSANPMAMRAALEDLAATAVHGRHPRRVAVLGEMRRDLGSRARELYLEVGADARRAGVDLLVAVGPRGETYRNGFGGQTLVVRDVAEAASVLPGLLRPHDVVLVKGSRAVALEAVCRAIIAAHGAAAPPPGRRCAPG